MANFFPGQLLRKVRGKVNIGSEGRFARYFQRDLTDCEVAPLGAWVSAAGVQWPAGQISHCLSNHWEPILPEGHRASDYTFSELMDKCREGIVA